MTERQLYLLGLLGDGTIRQPPLPESREAVRAVLAEWKTLFDLVERFDVLDTDPHVTDAEWGNFRRDVRAELARANGGT